MFRDRAKHYALHASSAAAVVLGAAMLLSPIAHAAPPLRNYATAVNVDGATVSVTEKERLVNAVLDRWQAAALRFGADPVSWSDSFGLQLSLLPSAALQEVATQPIAAFHLVAASPRFRPEQSRRP